MNNQVKCVKITADGIMSEVQDFRADEDWKAMRGREGHALPRPEKWGYNLTIYMLDYFEETDQINKTASVIYSALQHFNMHSEKLRGTVFITNEDSGGQVNFTVKELNGIICKACIPRVLGVI